jgi:RNA polymerase sigma-70 factor (sigma-E family)
MSFEEFVAARLRTLLQYAVALTGNRELAQDVVQEALARAYLRWRRISRMDRPELYVRRMITNEFLSIRRRKRFTMVGLIPGLHDRAAPDTDQANVLADRDDMSARLATLSRRHRAVLVLRYYEDLSDTEIAEVLNCAPGTVRAHASRAIARLRDDYFATSTPEPLPQAGGRR